MNHSITWVKPLKRYGKGLAAVVFWLCIWWIFSAAVAEGQRVTAPVALWEAFTNMVVRGDFWASTGLSLLRIMAGWLIGVMAGSLLAVFTTRFSWADVLLSPLLRIVRAAPVASFIILALVWVRTDVLPLFIAFLMVTPPGSLD